MKLVEAMRDLPWNTIAATYGLTADGVIIYANIRYEESMDAWHHFISAGAAVGIGCIGVAGAMGVYQRIQEDPTIEN